MELCFSDWGFELWALSVHIYDLLTVVVHNVVIPLKREIWNRHTIVRRKTDSIDVKESSPALRWNTRIRCVLLYGYDWNWISRVIVCRLILSDVVCSCVASSVSFPMNLWVDQLLHIILRVSLSLWCTMCLQTTLLSNVVQKHGNSKYMQI